MLTDLALQNYIDKNSSSYDDLFEFIIRIPSLLHSHKS